MSSYIVVLKFTKAKPTLFQRRIWFKYVHVARKLTPFKIIRYSIRIFLNYISRLDVVHTQYAYQFKEKTMLFLTGYCPNAFDLSNLHFWISLFLFYCHVFLRCDWRISKPLPVCWSAIDAQFIHLIVHVTGDLDVFI